MKARVLLLPACILFAAFSFAQGEAQTEQAKFAGTWEVESATADGEDMPQEVVKKFKMTFKSDTYVMVIGQEKTEGAIRIDPAKDPKSIDIRPETGPDRGQTQRGIYQFDGDKLKICAAQPGKDRPTDFETKGKVGYTMLVLRRAK